MDSSNLANFIKIKKIKKSFNNFCNTHNRNAILAAAVVT